MKYILAVLLAIIAGIAAYYFLFQSEEAKIKKRFSLLSEYVEKQGNENKLVTMAKAKKIGSLFTENATFSFPERSVEKTLTRDEIVIHAASVIGQYIEMSLKFNDMDIEVHKNDSATVRTDATVKGKISTGEYVKDDHEISCLLIKTEDEWLFSEIQIVEVFNK